jgi:DnaK suppressor protein
MGRSEIARYRGALEAKRAELASALRSLEGISIEKSADALDEVQFAGERDLAISNLDRDSRLLRSVRSALARMEDGSYGICLHYDSAISPKPLSAVPWTAYCLACQEAADRHEFDVEAVGELTESLAGVA